MPLPLPELASIEVQPAGELVQKTKPRYYISAAGGKPPMFWEREPFVWDDEEGRVSRFISLGAFGGEPAPGKKQRVSVSTIANSFDLYVTVVLRVLNISSNPNIRTSSPA